MIRKPTLPHPQVDTGIPPARLQQKPQANALPENNSVHLPGKGCVESREPTPSGPTLKPHPTGLAAAAAAGQHPARLRSHRN